MATKSRAHWRKGKRKKKRTSQSQPRKAGWQMTTPETHKEVSPHRYCSFSSDFSSVSSSFISCAACSISASVGRGSGLRP